MTDLSATLSPPLADPRYLSFLTQDTTDKIHVRLAKTQAEIEAAQKLRYRVFYEEWGAKPTEQMRLARQEFDEFDSIMDHLIVIDPSLPTLDQQVVGTYRLLRDDVGRKMGKFYSANEFDVTPLLASGQRVLELGRSCVLDQYRTMPVIQLLWQGICDYVNAYKIDLMFGCACLYGNDVDAVKEELSYLYHYHLAEEGLRARALPHVYVDMNLMPKEKIDRKKAFQKLEPLIKGYLRIGAMIGDGAYIDPQFNSIDVCIIMPTKFITGRYARHYGRHDESHVSVQSMIKSEAKSDSL
jgi:L-ornithine Nalpha-acyltransferase